MKCVSYNIQYGIGLDYQYDIGRIIDAVRGADIICLQEVSRNNPSNGGHDMVAAINHALPDYFSVYGPNFEADMGSRIANGKAVTTTFQFGNMILSRKPILLSRNLLLPRTRTFDYANFQRGALEALIETPSGYVRFYSTHLDHRSPDERLEQIRFLKDRIFNYPVEGGGLTGLAEYGLPEPPSPNEFIVMGDFNMLSDTPEHAALCGTPDAIFGLTLNARHAVDVAAYLGALEDHPVTWVDPNDPKDEARMKRIDYVFASPFMADRLKSYRVDREAVGSDHLPVWVELA
ncbi:MULTISPECIES: endonuclease/exonuclease/phosphatase family protein [Mesorhizobium]|uniref:EEP domain-containing protein n=1 Tax=Mesorhizobium denitrificans TaxID=2294114 RepID=A0A371XEN0_9HYPH|nr:MULTISPECIES: endonuclease/exonuclease/phosphatase family protein [Mesorhizobium]RFC67672.1 EEP domain-containing protein [Mesorhizobium denitrificans]